MIGRFCLDCWLGDCEQVRLAHITPVSVVDCPCCRRGHDWTDELVGPVVASVTSSGIGEAHLLDSIEPCDPE